MNEWQSWSPDSRWPAWDDKATVYVAPADGRGPTRRLAAGYHVDWSP